MSSFLKKVPILKNIISHYKKIKTREIEKINILKTINNNILLLIDEKKVNLDDNNYPLEVNYPPFLHNIELTNKCPMHCVACPRPYDMKRTLGFMDMTIFKRLLTS